MAHHLPKRLHFLARYVDGQWMVECLDFSLGAQDATMEGAHRRVLAQVSTYVHEALTMDGGAHAEQLLNRRAPWGDWLLFRVGMLLRVLHAASSGLSGYQRPFQLQSA